MMAGWTLVDDDLSMMATIGEMRETEETEIGTVASGHQARVSAATLDPTT